MPEPLRRRSIKIYESPLHRGSQHGSPAFRKKRFKYIKSDSQLSGSDEGGMMEIAPPPRNKRSSLPGRQVSTSVIRRPPNKPPKPPPAATGLHYHAVTVTSENNHSKISSNRHPTSAAANNATISSSRNIKLCQTTPPKSALGSFSGRTPQDDEDHIYESVDLRQNHPTLTTASASNTLRGQPPLPPGHDVRLSTEVQCWPWLPKQGSLPAQTTVTITNGTSSSPKKSSIGGVGSSITAASLAKTIQSSLRSVSLGRGSEPPRSAPTILQRFSNLRRSLNRSDRFRSQESQTNVNSMPRRPDDPDWVFFRGFGAKKREDVEPYAAIHGPLLTVTHPAEDTPKAPPRRKRPQRLLTNVEDEKSASLPLRRSLSFTDAHYIAQAMCEGDTKLIEELYPDFPRSEPIYAVIDKSKKRLSHEVKPVEVRGRSTGPDGPTVSLIPDMLPVHQENSRESSTSITSSSVRSSSTTITTSTSASSSTVAPFVAATASTGTTAATRAKTSSSSPTSKPAAAQKDQRILPIVDNLENVVNNKGKNNKNEQENDKVNLSSEPDNKQDKRNYAKEMTSELEMFAENNNGQNLQKSTKGGGTTLPTAVLPDVVHDSEVEAKNNNNNNNNTSLNNGVTVIEVNGGVGSTTSLRSSTSTTWQSNVHPFAHRTQQRYARKIHVASPQAQPNHTSNNTLNGGHHGGYEESLEDSFEKILQSADHSICQAESILTNLRQRSQTLPVASSLQKCDNSEDSDSLGSDIESNIRKLEKTQAKINAALEAFRSIKEDPSPTQSRSPTTIASSGKVFASPSTEKTVGASPASMSRPLTVVNIQKQQSGSSRTAPAQMQSSSRGPLSRRHSFNNNNNKVHSSPKQLQRQTSSSSATSSNPRYYEADVESDFNAKDGSWSDSESGFLHPPIKAKLKGLLGTWGRNVAKKRSKNHLPLGPSISDPVPILQPPTASVSDYARRIELLAQDLSNGSALTKNNNNNPSSNNRRSASPASSNGGYYTPPSVLQGNPPETETSSPPENDFTKKMTTTTSPSSVTMASTSTKKSSSPESSQRNSVSSESEDLSDSEEQASASISSTCTSNTNEGEQKNKTKAFYIANELMTSERVYVDVLKLLNGEFRDFLQKARRESKSGLMPDTDYSRLFNNLPELQTLNEDLLQDFENRIAHWSVSPKIADVIVKKGPFLKLYTTYIREFSAVNYHFDDCCQKFPKFSKLVKDFEKKELCRHLKLKHFMLKPVQRLPQYKLLLEDYLRHLSHESSDFDDTTAALKIVSDAAEHANNTIRQGDKFRKMLQLQSRIGDYFELIKPGRDLIKEGELQKISRKGISPRYFILLSDYLLYTTYSGSWSGSDTTSLRVSYQIPLSTLTVKLPPTTHLNTADSEMATELHLTSPIRSFGVRAPTIRERNAWLDALNTAIEDHNSRKATFFHNDQRIECKMGVAPPIWVPDRRVTMCQNCTVEFTVLIRRHHCRACGQVVCSTCSANKAPLRYLEFDSARVCDSCYDSLEKELGHVESLRSRFKKRTLPKTSRYVPHRLKLSANGEGAQMSGYLRKKYGKNGAKWRRFWFVLKDGTLYAYKAPEDSVACDNFPILGYILETLSEKNIELYEGENGGLVFQLAHPRNETLTFCADNDNICEKWIAAINEAVQIDP